MSDWAFHPGSSFAAGDGGNARGWTAPRGASASGHRHFRSPADGVDASDDDGEGGDAKVESPTNALQIWSFSVAEVS